MARKKPQKYFVIFNHNPLLVSGARPETIFTVGEADTEQCLTELLCDGVPALDLTIFELKARHFSASLQAHIDHGDDD